MKFLAWDVGIKNLAYSIIDYNIELKTKEIIDWGIVNLMNEVDEDEHKMKICCETNQNGNKCSSKAIFLFQDNPDKGVCKKHNSILKYKFTKFLDLSQTITCSYEIKGKKKGEVKKCSKESIAARKSNLNISYCSQHLKIIQKTETFEIYDLSNDKKKLVKGLTVLMLAKRLYQHLDNLKNVLLDVDEIIIENQPVLKNPTMKTMQILLYGYFIMNGILKDKVKNIHFFSASKKLEAYDDVDGKIIGTLSHLSGQYQVNKKAAILYTLEMIKHSAKWMGFFNTHSKKDDLADAYLTNCYFIDRKFKEKNQKITKTPTKKPKAKSEEKTEHDGDDSESDLFGSDGDVDIEDTGFGVESDSEDEIKKFFEENNPDESKAVSVKVVSRKDSKVNVNSEKEKEKEKNKLEEIVKSMIEEDEEQDEEDDDEESTNIKLGESKPKDKKKFVFNKYTKKPMFFSNKKEVKKEVKQVNPSDFTSVKIPIPKSILATVKNPLAPSGKGKLTLL